MRKFVKVFEEDVRNPFRVSCKAKLGGSKFAEIELKSGGFITIGVPHSVRWSFASMKEYFRTENGQARIDRRLAFLDANKPKQAQQGQEDANLTHKHKYVPYGDTDFPGARCSVCGEDGGWWCPNSPDHTCDYRQGDGSLDNDSCRHCGQPYERK